MTNQTPPPINMTRYYVIRWLPSSTSTSRDRAGARVVADLPYAIEEFESVHLDPVFARDTIDLFWVDMPLGVTAEKVRLDAIAGQLSRDVKFLASRTAGRTAAQWHNEGHRRAARDRADARLAATPPHWTIETIADTDRTYGMTMHRGNQSTQISCTPEEADDLLVAMMRARYAKDFEQATRDLLRLQERAIHDYTHGKE